MPSKLPLFPPSSFKTKFCNFVSVSGTPARKQGCHPTVIRTAQRCQIVIESFIMFSSDVHYHVSSILKIIHFPPLPSQIFNFETYISTRSTFRCTIRLLKKICCKDKRQTNSRRFFTTKGMVCNKVSTFETNLIFDYI